MIEFLQLMLTMLIVIFSSAIRISLTSTVKGHWALLATSSKSDVPGSTLGKRLIGILLATLPLIGIIRQTMNTLQLQIFIFPIGIRNETIAQFLRLFKQNVMNSFCWCRNYWLPEDPGWRRKNNVREELIWWASSQWHHRYRPYKI